MVAALRLLVLPFIVTVALDAQAPAPRPTATAGQPIVGTWQLMTRTVRRADGTTIVDPVLGEKPTGRLVYDASGAMSLQMMRTGRKDAISTSASPTGKRNPRVILGCAD